MGDDGHYQFKGDSGDENGIVEYEHIHNLTEEVIQIQMLLTSIQMENRVSSKRLDASNECKFYY